MTMKIHQKGDALLKKHKQLFPKIAKIPKTRNMTFRTVSKDDLLLGKPRFKPSKYQWDNETPIRKLGGVIFCDRRYDLVFVYHNSAPSFYSSRGFRGSLKL